MLYICSVINNKKYIEMNIIQRQIVKTANVNVLDTTYKTLPNIKKDITKRLKSQKRALAKNELKNTKLKNSIKNIISDSIEKLTKTLDTINNIEKNNF